MALDGTKMRANASRHSALSYEHAGKLEAQLKVEMGVLLAKAEAADKADVPDGMSIPEELERREERLKKLAEAHTKIEARAGERFAREQAEYEAKIAAREATGQLVIQRGDVVTGLRLLRAGLDELGEAYTTSRLIVGLAAGPAGPFATHSSSALSKAWPGLDSLSKRAP